MRSLQRNLKRTAVAGIGMVTLSLATFGAPTGIFDDASVMVRHLEAVTLKKTATGKTVLGAANVTNNVLEDCSDISVKRGWTRH